MQVPPWRMPPEVHRSARTAIVATMRSGVSATSFTPHEAGEERVQSGLHRVEGVHAILR